MSSGDLTQNNPQNHVTAITNVLWWFVSTNPQNHVTQNHVTNYYKCSLAVWCQNSCNYY